MASQSDTVVREYPFFLQQALDQEKAESVCLVGEQSADVAIVGGGYAGLWTAIEIKQAEPSADVAVLEAVLCGNGASGRNGGMIVPLFTKLPILEAQYGRDHGMQIVQASREAADHLEKWSADGGDFDFRRSGWLWTADCAAHLGVWNGLATLLEKRGIDVMQLLDSSQTAEKSGSKAFRGGVLIKDGASVQPGKLARALRRRALDLGIRIYERSPVTNLNDAERFKFRTPSGSLGYRRAVITVNAWANQISELSKSLLVIMSDGAVSTPIPEKLKRLGIEHMPYWMDSNTFVNGARSTADGRLFVGVTGGAIPFGSLGTRMHYGPSDRLRDLEASLRRYYPELASVPLQASWRGAVDRSRDGLPFFGHLNGRPEVSYGLGFSGNGICVTPLAGKILAALTLEVKNEWSTSGMVGAQVSWLPREPVRYLGSRMVRWAVRRRDQQAARGKPQGLAVRLLADLVPSGLVSTRAKGVPEGS